MVERSKGANIYFLLARPSQDVYLLPFIPWIEQGGSKLLVTLSTHLYQLNHWCLLRNVSFRAYYHVISVTQMKSSTTFPTYLCFSQFLHFFPIRQDESFIQLMAKPDCSFQTCSCWCLFRLSGLYLADVSSLLTFLCFFSSNRLVLIDILIKTHRFLFLITQLVEKTSSSLTSWQPSFVFE